MTRWSAATLNIIAAVVLALTGSSLSALSCQQTGLLVQKMLASHLNRPELTPELMREVVANYVKSLDSGKLYFLVSDIQDFEKNYPVRILNEIKKGRCKAIDQIYAVYDQRYQYGQRVIDQLLAETFRFDERDSVILDPDKMGYPVTQSAIKNRWKLRLKYMTLSFMDAIKEPKSIKEKLKAHFRSRRKKFSRMSSEKVYGKFLNAFAHALDPHSDYYSPSDVEEFNIQQSLSLQGIGAVLRSEAGITIVQKLSKGGPAEKSGLIQEDDKIVAVAQGSAPPVDIVDMDLSEVVSLIRGPEGSMVRLTLRRKGETHTAALRRERIKLEESAVTSQLFVAGQGKSSRKMGYIDIPSFYQDFEARSASRKEYRSVSRDVQAEIAKLIKQGAETLVLDLRFNGGGSLDEAVNLAGMFLGPGPIVQQKGEMDKVSVRDYDGPRIFSGPLVVLISRQSASASEIVAGALQDYQRALIVGGDHTFGKGTVQMLHHLGDPSAGGYMGALKVTISTFYLPSGRSTQLRGVSSDIALPSVWTSYDIGEKHYPAALPWSQVAPAPHGSFPAAKPGILKLLKERSTKRVGGSRAFQKLAATIAQLEKDRDSDFEIPLNPGFVPWNVLSQNNKANEKLTKAAANAATEKSEDVPLLERDPILEEALLVSHDLASVLAGQPLPPAPPPVKQLFSDSKAAP